MSTGMPAGIWLTKFGMLIFDAFGHVAYHVGSSLSSKQWRDVDVRLILPDDEFKDLFGDNQNAETNKKLAAVTLAFSVLGKHMTGLPIDFQVQTVTHANKAYPGPRSALIEVDESNPDTSGRCFSCDHPASSHTSPQGCLYVITNSRLESSLVCPCSEVPHEA